MKKIILSNFKGIESLTLDLQGSVSVRGTNGTGKTTILDAICWAITGKDSQGRSDFEIKTRAGNDFKKDVEHSVEIQAKNWAIKRDYVPKWGRKKELKGHSTEYYVDNGAGLEPVKKTGEDGFDAYVKNKIGDNFRMLSDAKCFAEKMDWKNRRDIVFQVAGKIEDSDVIETFSPKAKRERLTKWLEDNTDGEMKSNLKKKLTYEKKELDKIIISLAEAKLRIPELDKTKLENIKKDISSLEKQETDLINKITNIKFGEELQEELQQAKKEMRDAENQHYEINATKKKEHLQKEEKMLDGYRERMRELKEKLDRVEETIDKIDFENGCKKRDKKRLEAELEDMRREFKGIKDSVWNGETVCKACGQELPGEGIEKQKEEFQTKRANRLLKIKEQGEKIKEKIADIQMLNVSEFLESQDKIKNMIKELEEQRPQVMPLQLEEFDDKPYIEKIYMAEKKIRNAESTVLERKQELQEERSEILQKITKLKIEIEVEKIHKEANDRVEYLLNSQKESGERITELEVDIALIDAFIHKKVELMEKMIYEAFGVRFKMFSYNLTNDSFTECCEVMVDCNGNSIPYSTANNATQINTGIHLCEVLQNYFKVDLPIIIDNAESVVEIQKTKKQTIRLVVDPTAKKLEVK